MRKWRPSTKRGTFQDHSPGNRHSQNLHCIFQTTACAFSAAHPQQTVWSEDFKEAYFSLWYPGDEEVQQSEGAQAAQRTGDWEKYREHKGPGACRTENIAAVMV